MLLLRKGVYPYDHTNEWERFKEIALPKKEKLYNQLNIEDITEVDYVHAKRVYKNFRKTGLEIYELDPAKFISTPGLVWQAALKKTQ